MREITTHKVNACNEAITVEAVELAGPGTASPCYCIHFPVVPSAERNYYELRFQNGPINEVGTNGLTHEALLAVIIDRLQSFQMGPYKCRENAIALTHLEDAMHWLQHRTRARVARGVEGTHVI